MMLQRSERAKYEPSHHIPTLPASTSSYGQWRRKFLQIALVFICGSVGDRSFIKAWAVLLLHQGWGWEVGKGVLHENIAVKV